MQHASYINFSKQGVCLAVSWSYFCLQIGACVYVYMWSLPPRLLLLTSYSYISEINQLNEVYNFSVSLWHFLSLIWLNIMTNQPITKAYHECQPKKTKTILFAIVYINSTSCTHPFLAHSYTVNNWYNNNYVTGFGKTCTVHTSKFSTLMTHKIYCFVVRKSHFGQSSSFLWSRFLCYWRWYSY